MREWQSLSHVRWYCRYHVVFVPKYRKRMIFGQLRKGIGGILRQLCEQEGIAQAAGTAPYFQADDAQQLNTALQTIAEAVATCSYTVSNPSQEQMYVFFNNDAAGVPNDPANGWTYDPVTHTLEFVGASCADIKNGVVEDIDVVFGCPAPTPD